MATILAPLDDLLPDWEVVYRDLHAHPELSMQETRTSGVAADRLRAFDEGVRTRVLAAIARIVHAEAAASGAPREPEITPLGRYALVRNDAEATTRVRDAFRSHFPADRVQDTLPTTGSEDFGCFGAQWGVPSVLWFVGGTDPDRYAQAEQAGTLGEIPTNHNPRFAPVIHPTLRTGVEALVVAAGAWLAR